MFVICANVEEKRIVAGVPGAQNGLDFQLSVEERRLQSLEIGDVAPLVFVICVKDEE